MEGNPRKFSLPVSLIPFSPEQILAENEVIRRASHDIIANSKLAQQNQKIQNFKKNSVPTCDLNNLENNQNSEKGTKQFKKVIRIFDPNGPKDNYQVIRIMFLVLGLVHMLPLTFFSTANEYWMYKFRNASDPIQDPKNRTFLQANFASIQMIFSIVPSTICTFILMFVGHKININTRIFYTLLVSSITFVLCTTFVEINTDDWQVGFFILTMANIVILNISGTFASTGNLTSVSQFPEVYLKTYFIGEGMSGLFTAILRLISIVCTPSTTGAALIYFVTGSVLMTLSTVFFALGKHNKFYKHYTKSMQMSTKKKIPTPREVINVLKYNWVLLIPMYITILIPQGAITNLVVSEYHGTGNTWDKYFVTCTTFLLRAVCDIFGRLIFYRFEYDIHIALIYVALLGTSAIFFPLMLFTNAQPRHHLPVLFPHDWEYALFTALQALSGGYVGNLIAMKSLRIIPPEKLELSFMVTSFLLRIIISVASPLGVLYVSLL